jgi:hypothetical protein
MAHFRVKKQTPRQGIDFPTAERFLKGRFAKLFPFSPIPAGSSNQSALPHARDRSNA